MAVGIANAVEKFLVDTGPFNCDNVDVILILDSSGSMGGVFSGIPSGNDPFGKRKDAARAFITASVPGDFVGVVDFDHNSRLASPLLRVPDNKTSLTSAIDTIDSSGGTNIGIGIQEGCDASIASLSRNATKAAIVLTDGLGAFSDKNTCFSDRGWPIYTFGFGSSNDFLLQQIALNTDGEFRRLPTSDFVCEFQRVRAKIANIEPGSCTVEHLHPEERISVFVTIPPRYELATFSTSWVGSDVAMTLTTPSGRVIDRSTVAPDVAHDKGATFEIYTITNPEAGEWEVELFGLDVPPDGEDVVFGSTSIPAPIIDVKVAIGIKPGGDSNSINCNNERGVFTVAILATEAFDPTTVDRATVTLEGAQETHINKKTGAPRRHEEDVDGDGDIDIVLHFRLGETDLKCDSIEASLMGETFDGQTIVGTDSVHMIGN